MAFRGRHWIAFWLVALLAALWAVEGALAGRWFSRAHVVTLPALLLAALALFQSVPLPGIGAISFDPYETRLVAARILAAALYCALLLRYTDIPEGRIRSRVLGRPQPDAFPVVVVQGNEMGPLLVVVVLVMLVPLTLSVTVRLPAAAPSSQTVNHTVPFTMAPLAGSVMKTLTVPPADGLIVKVSALEVWPSALRTVTDTSIGAASGASAGVSPCAGCVSTRRVLSGPTSP